MSCRTLFAASAAVVALFLAGCGPDLESQLPDELKTVKGSATASPTYALKTTDAHVAGVTPTWKASFPIATTIDLFVASEVTGTLKGHHTLSVFLFTPGGSAYQRFDVPFATDVAAAGNEQQAEKTATGWRVWVNVPVAATMIQTSNLAGSWTSELWVDSAMSANAKGGFSLQ